MENRSHALLAGLFVLFLAAAAAVTAVWLGRKDVKYEPYVLVSKYPVAGLSIQSQVRYQGMAVGQVQGLSIDKDKPGTIRVQIGVVPDTPITEGTWAEIATQGVTGISNIDLRDDGEQPKRVTSTAADPYEIPVRPGFFQKLQNAGVGMLEDGEEVLDDLRKFITDENAERFTLLLDNAEKLSGSLNDAAIRLKPAIDALPGVIAKLDQTLVKFDQVGTDVTRLTQSAQKTIDYLNSPTGPLTLATQSLAQLQRSAAQLQSSTLPEISRMMDDISAAARSFSGAARLFEQSPDSVLFGPPPAKPGPGEPGFNGFSGFNQE
ncbi:MAG: MlaD family protein [Burkholderiaceae bacterium]|nr:MlaD family protein [Burkholderiaceae bacterium]MCD8517903.1 MlaD family protein [Burkholderiaceae bacterium]MCD8536521.1 MlaD family protein [Burkholderiaceae bacterium]MCD8565357.1 MlaD family protein [Burkholderiaceae bacterium]